MNKYIGKLQGRLLVFGGVYSNFHALEALKSKAASLDIVPDHIICTGDIVAYCAYPSECLDYIQDWGIHVIAGNVELNLLDQADDCGCNFNEGSRCDIFSKQWYPYAKASMTPRNLDFLTTIPHHLTFDYYDRRIKVVHGTPSEVSGYVFKSTPWNTKLTLLNETSTDVILAGHSGLPFIDNMEDKYWINAGVIGMPANDGKANTWFCTIDQAKNTLKVTFHALDYQHQSASTAMIEQGLPATYAKTLLNGIWDNCEILPEYETVIQGEPIDFRAKPYKT